MSGTPHEHVGPEPAAAAAALSLLEQVIRYHQETKHHFFRYARSLGYLDWANQPDPFRRFQGAPLIPLPILRPDEEPPSPPYEALYRYGAVESQPLSIRTLSRFFEYALALSAWKQAGGVRWSLRSNPSSGNLHPTEGYVLLPAAPGLSKTPALYHYAPKEHGLEMRATYSADAFERLMAPFPPHAFLFGLTSVFWREAWKYGERAFRYCQHDVGHAIGTARFAAASLGWRMALLDGLSSDLLADLFGVNRAEDFRDTEREHPECVAVVWPDRAGRGQGLGVRGSQIEIPLFLDAAVVNELAAGQWYGKANRLSHEHAVHWDIIDEVAEASWKAQTEKRTVLLHDSPVPATRDPLPLTPDGSLAGQIIRRRRSAVAFDGKTSISAATFFGMLLRVMPQAHLPQMERPSPWDLWPWSPAVHVALFVHRVEGLGPGLYVLVRDPEKLPLLQRAMNPEFGWAPAPGCPAGLPLFWLLEGDARRVAAQVSCHQDIAGDGAFSLGMIAEFEGNLGRHGPWFYSRLFWECGLLGQVLYLEAEAAGVRATGIGCFFDDPVHDLLGIKDLTFQSLYHFTVGGPVDDPRLLTLPPYESRDT
ncbi:MAG: SagB/ThcOx family dehydrogenase [Nitrospirota bacterium]